MKLPRRRVTHCDSSSSFLYPSISMGGALSHSAWNQTKNGVCPPLLSFPLPPSVPAGVFFFFFSFRLAARPLECSLWPSHWQMLLWNVMKFEMGAAVTIILGQGLSLAWYHYLWQLESATRERESQRERERAREMERLGDRQWSHRVMSVWRQESKQVVHSWKDSGLFSPTELCLHILVFGLTRLFIEQVSCHFKAGWRIIVSKWYS